MNSHAAWSVREWQGAYCIYREGEPVIRNDGEVLRLYSEALALAVVDELTRIGQGILFQMACDYASLRARENTLSFSIADALKQDRFLQLLRSGNSGIRSLAMERAALLLSHLGLHAASMDHVKDYVQKQLVRLTLSQKVFLAHFSSFNLVFVPVLWYLQGELSIQDLVEIVVILTWKLECKSVEGEFFNQAREQFAEDNREYLCFLSLSLPADPA